MVVRALRIDELLVLGADAPARRRLLPAREAGDELSRATRSRVTRCFPKPFWWSCARALRCDERVR